MKAWNAPVLTTEQKETITIPYLGEDGNVRKYNPAKEAVPRNVGNKSRIGFLYNPYYHPLGKFFQGKVKIAILKCIDFVHASLLRYDPDAYQFDDPRLLELQKTGTDCINALFESEVKEDPFRKISFMLKLLDIGLFLMKEDIWYRPRFIELMKQMGRTAEHLEPTGAELVILTRGNHGISDTETH